MIRIEHILFARDFSSCSDRAFPHALELAARTGATLHTIYAEVLRDDPFVPSEAPATPADKVRERLRRFAEEATAGHGGYDPESVRCRHAVVHDTAAAPAIVRYAEEHAVDVVVMGTHGRRGVRRLLLGSVAEEVVRTAPCPVLVVRSVQADPKGRVQRLLVPVDFSTYSRSALRHARALARLYDAQLTLLHVVEEVLHPAFYFSGGMSSIYDVDPHVEERAVEQMRRLYRETVGGEAEGDDGVRIEARSGRASTEIAAYADEADIDLVVMPTHGRTGLEHLTMGSVAERVVRTAPCSVFTVGAQARALIEEPEGSPGAALD